MSQIQPPPPEAQTVASEASFRVELPNFEGPLDLLLHLIRSHELDVLDLPISFITEKYLEYIGLMKQLNLDLAAEYLVMAATLAHIKSKMLLPRPPLDQDDDGEDQLDPRAELIRRLLEYQKYKRVAEQLGARGVAGRDVFMRGVEVETAVGPAPLAEVSAFKLIDALKKVAERLQGALSLEIDADRISVQDRMTEIIDLLQTRRRCQFEELFDGATSTHDLVVTFLAVLEMSKMRIISTYQTEHDGPIHVEYVLLDAEGQPLVPNDLTDPHAVYEEPVESIIVPASYSTDVSLPADAQLPELEQ